MTSGTDDTDAIVAISAFAGRVGMTTVKSVVQTATHERPIHASLLRCARCVYSAIAIPKLLRTRNTSPMFIIVLSGSAA